MSKPRVAQAQAQAQGRGGLRRGASTHVQRLPEHDAPRCGAHPQDSVLPPVLRVGVGLAPPRAEDVGPHGRRLPRQLLLGPLSRSVAQEGAEAAGVEAASRRPGA